MFDIAKPSLGLNCGKTQDWNAAIYSDLRHGFRIPGKVGSPEIEYDGPRDARGWPEKQFESLIDGFNYPDGVYYATAQGCNVAFTGVGMDAYPEAVKGSLVFKGQGGKLKMTVTPTAANYFFSIIVPGESPLETGIWRKQFLDDIRRASVFRTLDSIPTNDSPVVNPADLPGSDPICRTYVTWGPSALRGGWPVADVVDLARRTGATPWYVMPPMANVDTWATILTTLSSLGRPVILEACNEPWNSGFSVQYQWLNDNAPAFIKGYAQQMFGSNGADAVKYGTAILHATKRECDLSVLAKTTMGKNAIVVRSGRLDAWANDFTLTYAKAELGHDPASTYSALAIAPYFGDAWTCRDGVHGFGPDMTLDQVFAGLNESISQDVVPAIKASKAVADKYGLSLIAYEAGQHLFGDSPNRAVYDQAQTDPRMADLYHRMADAWKPLGGLMCLYNHIERPFNPAKPDEPHTRWGLKTRLEDDDAPKFKAFVSVAATWNGEPPVVDPPVVSPVEPPREPHAPEARPAVFVWVPMESGVKAEEHATVLLRFGAKKYALGYWDGSHWNEQVRADTEEYEWASGATDWSYIPDPANGGGR